MKKNKIEKPVQQVTKSVNSEALQRLALANAYANMVERFAQSDMVSTNYFVNHEIEQFCNKRLNELLNVEEKEEGFNKQETLVLKSIAKKALDVTQTVKKPVTGQEEVVKHDFVKEAEKALLDKMNNNPEALASVGKTDINKLFDNVEQTQVVNIPTVQVVPDQDVPQPGQPRRRKLSLPANYQPPTPADNNAFAHAQAQVTDQGLKNRKVTLGTIQG